MSKVGTTIAQKNQGSVLRSKFITTSVVVFQAMPKGVWLIILCDLPDNSLVLLNIIYSSLNTPQAPLRMLFLVWVPQAQLFQEQFFQTWFSAWWMNLKVFSRENYGGALTEFSF